jgi:hypothetical protein
VFVREHECVRAPFVQSAAAFDWLPACSLDRKLQLVACVFVQCDAPSESKSRAAQWILYFIFLIAPHRTWRCYEQP